MDLFEQKVKSYIDAKQLIAPKDHLLVACSGGVDSIGLLHFLHNYKEQLGFTLSCVHVDHMLRGEVSKEDMRFVAQLCQHYEIPFYGKSIDIPRLLQEEGGNSQALCRRERYQYFQKVMEEIGATTIVTAHHADDQVESMLMSLTKNSAIKGLAGIYPKRSFYSGKLIRPFLAVTKDEIRGYLQKKQLSWREDSSNAKDDYTRNRFRHHVIPQLREENPNVASNFVRISDQIREDDQYLMTLAEQRFSNIVLKIEENIYNLKIEALKREPVALQRRFILILLNYIYGDFNAHQSYTLSTSILNLCDSVNGNAELHLPNNIIARREYSLVTLQPKQNEVFAHKLMLTMNEWCQFGDYRLFFGNLEREIPINSEKLIVYYFNSTTISLPISVRSIKKGDRILVKGMQHEKRVSRIFIDEKIPSQKRSKCPIITEQEHGILAVVGLRYCNKFSESKRPDDDRFILIEGESL